MSAAIIIAILFAENAICGASLIVTVGDAEYPVPPSNMSILSHLPPFANTAFPVAVPALNATVGCTVYPEPLVLIVIVFIDPVVEIAL
mgnify:CR=1 FL=1